MTSLRKKRDRDIRATGGLSPKFPQVTMTGSGQSQIARSSIVCYNCGKARHMHASFRLVPRGVATMSCYKCG